MTPHAWRAARAPVLAALALAASAACADDLPTAATPGGARVSLATDARDSAHPVALVAGDVVVRLGEGVDHEAVERQYGLRHAEALLLPRAEVVTVAAGAELAAAHALAADPRVEFAEANYLTVLDPCAPGACATPSADAPAAYAGTNDTFRGYRWDLDNDGAVRVGDRSLIIAASGRADADIDWLEMYEHLGREFAGAATIGVVDTGIRDTHQDLAGRVAAKRNFATGYAADFTEDRNGHGTHVAGIAAARGGNALGVMGVAYGANVRLLNAKACELYLFPDNVVRTSCPASSTANAIVWAADNGANVINLSFAGDARAASGSAAQQAALRYARSRNVLPFCASGNEGIVTSIAFPARFPECVAVGATDWGDQRAPYSNASPDVDLSAPGGTTASNVGPFATGASYLLSTYNRSDADYVFLTGTSMAAPQAAGLAAMLYATGMTSADAVLARLQESADDLGPAGADPEFGAGRINAFRAVTGRSAPLPPTARTGGPYVVGEGESAYDGTASAPGAGGAIAAYRWQFSDGTILDGGRITKTFAQDSAAPHRLYLTVTESNGQTGTAATTVHVNNVPPTTRVALESSTIVSGDTARAVGSFEDPGVRDAPWTWTVTWGGDLTITGSTAIRTTTVPTARAYCAAGTYAVSFSVTDRDGGTGSASASVTVRRRELPLGAPASLGTSSAGRLPVTLFGDAELDVSRVSLPSVTLGDGAGAATPIARRRDGTPMARVEDANGDGRPDLTMHFERAALRAAGSLPEAGPATLVLLGTLDDGCVEVRATAASRVVPDVRH
jgi:thermitase